MDHMLAAKTVMDALPNNVHVNVSTTELSQGFAKTDTFYLDFWPFSRTFLVVSSPYAAMQVTKKYNLPTCAAARLLPSHYSRSKLVHNAGRAVEAVA